MDMLSKTLAIITLVSVVLLSAVLQSTTPATIHPLGILSVFILFYLSALGMLTFFMYGLSRGLSRLSIFAANARVLSFNQAYYFASVIALAPVLLIGMRSIGRGNLWDTALVIIFEIIACFYIAKR